MNTASKLYGLLGVTMMAICWIVACMGVSPTFNSTEVVPVSVRDNPASFRPSYARYTGWHPLPLPTSSGGGFGFGK